MAEDKGLALSFVSIVLFFKFMFHITAFVVINAWNIGLWFLDALWSWSSSRNYKA